MRLLRIALMLGLATAAVAAGPSRHVDPLIGTGGHGHTYPGATLPFGMVQLSPDTRLEGWDGCSGYHDSDRVVYGFSHTHLSGTGISDYGDVLLMPMTGVAQLGNGAVGGPDTGYASRFDKSTERAGPGWYEVRLADYDVSVELSATERAGVHRYGFPPGKPAHVVIDLTHRDEVLDASLRVVGDNEIEGHRRSRQWAADQRVYFVARFSRPFEQLTLADDERITTGGRRAVEGRNLKALLGFGDGGGPLEVHVGLSAVDVAGARRNLDLEVGRRGFDEVRRAAVDRWDDRRGGARAMRAGVASPGSDEVDGRRAAHRDQCGEGGITTIHGHEDPDLGFAVGELQLTALGAGGETVRAGALIQPDDAAIRPHQREAQVAEQQAGMDTELVDVAVLQAAQDRLRGAEAERSRVVESHRLDLRATPLDFVERGVEVGGRQRVGCGDLGGFERRTRRRPVRGLRVVVGDRVVVRQAAAVGEIGEGVGDQLLELRTIVIGIVSEVGVGAQCQNGGVGAEEVDVLGADLDRWLDALRVAVDCPGAPVSGHRSPV